MGMFSVWPMGTVYQCLFVDFKSFF
jgi:hypothetical protein